MTVSRVLAFPGAYRDSLLLLGATRAMQDSEDVSWATTAGEAARYLAEGQFPPGSMGPKIEAALRFLDGGGELAVITSPALLVATLAGHGPPTGTRIERAPSQSGQAR